MRSHAERLIGDLAEIRKELVAEVSKLTTADLDSSPNPDNGMKSYRAMLQEIGIMEQLCIGWLISGEMAEWESAVQWSGDDLPSLLGDLERIRATTNQFLHAVTEEDLQTARPLPEEWHQYMGPQVEPEELVRWVSRHEYYHLGQIIIYLWTSGDTSFSNHG